MTYLRARNDVLAERQRQMDQEGWTAAHDDEHQNGQMAAAAAAYALSGSQAMPSGNTTPPWFWPWSAKWWKPTNPRRDLVKAAALLIAEIERLDRIEESQNAD